MLVAGVVVRMQRRKDEVGLEYDQQLVPDWG